MAASDALALPLKNTAFRVYFDVRKNDGTLITGWTGAAATRSLDGATTGATTNTPTEIATNAGVGFLDLTAAEMNTNNTTIIVTVTNSGALPTTISLYPATDAMIHANVMDWNSGAVPAPSQTGVPITDPHYWNGTAVATPATAGIPDVNTKNIANAAVSTSSAQIGVNAVNWAGGAIPAPNVTGVPKVDVIDWLGSAVNALISGRVDATVGAMQSAVLNAAAFASNAITAAAINAGAIAQDVLNALAASYNLANTIGAKINAAGNAGDPWSIVLPGAYGATQAGGILANVQSHTNLIGTGQITVGTIPVLPSGATTIVAGSSYYNADGLALTYTLSGYPALTVATGNATWKATKADGTTLSVTGDTISSTQVRFELSPAQSALLISGSFSLTGIINGTAHTLKTPNNTLTVLPSL